MKVVTLVRTRDEAHIIDRCIASHLPCSDKILIADGGSTDNTLERVWWWKRQFPAVEIRHFEERTYVDAVHWYNPNSTHTKFLLAWAAEEKADWVIFDDADHEFNQPLASDIRKYMENPDTIGIYTSFAYLWGKDEFFPQLNPIDAAGRLLAWRPDVVKMPLLADKPDLHVLFEKMPLHSDPGILNLHNPYVVLHHGWPTPEITRRKMRFYKESGYELKWPPDNVGKPEPLPQWVQETRFP